MEMDTLYKSLGIIGNILISFIFHCTKTSASDTTS